MKTMKISAIALIAIALLVLTAGCVQPAGTPTPTHTDKCRNSVQQRCRADADAPCNKTDRRVYRMAAVCLNCQRERDCQSCRVFRPAATGGSNINHPCCILFARDDLLAQNPDLVTAISALTQASSTWINEHPAEAAEIEAEFLVGKGNFTYGNVTVSSVDVLNDAFPTVKYTNEPSPEWIAGTKKFVSNGN